jgi:acetyltransferase-like isoleucine patch superfamily enzyme
MAFYTRESLADQIAKKGWTVGEATYGTPGVREWGNDAKLHIGSYCSIAGGCRILLGGNHRSDWVTTYPFSVLHPEARHIKGHPATKGDVIIGHDVWIGENVTIVSGVTIGNGAVIAAGSVVGKNVPAYAIARGNPAEIARYRFTAPQIESLEKIAWWTWSPDKIKAHFALLLSGDIDAFIEKANSEQTPA